MTIVPSSRLLAWTALAGVPLLTVLGAGVGLTGLISTLLGAAAVLAGIDLARSRAGLGGLRVDGPQVLRLAEGREGVLPLVVETDTPLRDLTLALELPLGVDTPWPEAVVAWPEGEPAGRVDWPLVGGRRGRFRVRGVRAETRSPWGLWHRRGGHPLSVDVRVYPDLTSDRRLAGVFLRRGRVGAHTQRQLGKGREFEKLRDYVPGDSWDDIHWKASAKRGELVAKEYQIERTQEVYAVVDASRLSARAENGRPMLERYLEAALTLAYATRRHGDRFGLLTFDDQVRTFLPAGSGKSHFDAGRDALLSLEPRLVSPDFNELATFVRTRMRRRALLVFLTDLGDPAVADDFSRACELLSRRHLLLVTMPHPEGVEPLFLAPAPDRGAVARRLAGHLAWQRLRELERSLARRGVQMALVERPALAAEVVGRYVAVKQRQAL